MSEGYRLPSLYVIEPTNRCNMRCIMCPQNRQASFGDMTNNLFDQLLDQVSACARFIQLYHVGEPTLNPNLCEMISKIKVQSRASVEVSTNLRWRGKEDYAGRLIRSGVDRILCCIEGARSESHSQLRVTGDYDEAVSAVHRLAELNVALGRPVDVIVKCIESTFNAADRDSFKTYWAQVPGVRPTTTWLNTWAGTMPEVRAFATRLCPNENAQRRPCAEIWNKMVIRWNGMVVRCCHDWRGDHIVGDANCDSLKDIWNGKRLSDIRSQHLASRYEGLCNDCCEWSTVEEMVDDYGVDGKYLLQPSSGDSLES